MCGQHYIANQTENGETKSWRMVSALRSLTGMVREDFASDS